MVEIREETEGSDSHQNRSGGPSSSNNSNATPNQSRNVLEYVSANRLETLYFTLRLVTIYFAVTYLLPMFSGPAQKNAYMKAFVAGAATNAFRLHQRMRVSHQPIFSRIFLSELFLEDSAHYLFYSLIFAMATPVTMALVPLVLYAILHSLNFGLKTANEFGFGNSPTVARLTQLKTQMTPSALSMIAWSEIALLPIFTIMIFAGKANIFFPLIYSRFLSMRYVSRRNPYTRAVFANMKQSVLSFAGNQSCPPVIRNVLIKTVAFVERLSAV
ncbi:transmembrane protein 33 like protein [Ditylenchus destructor]|uniref:Transmembrane protein 33 like protein n=1 Tax=Ditylenchus destructor TaxID=166010 RepID=A0AAD4RBX0_9BILA|nr:transmembrane protein 33 like protein [Ditylenchus destructor]